MPSLTRARAPAPEQSMSRAALVPLADDAPLQPAGFISRFIALSLDILFVSVGALVFSALVSLILNFFGLSTEQTTLDETAKSLFGTLQIVILIVSSLAVLLFVPGYFVLFWALIGATPGKQIMGLRVIRTQGQPLGWVRAIVRYIGYFLSAIVLFIGFLWVFIDGRRQGWHDKLADTLVVYRWNVPPDA
jgi:uncharacterized RDD family membrane protein YckC